MRHKLFVFLTLLFLTLLAVPGQAQNYDFETFSNIPVLHEGRIKPMESFARAHLKYFSGQEKDALPWLVETLFNPAASENKRVLKIRNPAVLNLLELGRRKDRLFSYQEVSGALSGKQDVVLSILESPEENWTPLQRDLITLQKKTVLLGDLLGSLGPFLPLSIVLPEDVPNALKPYAREALAYLDAMKFRKALDQAAYRITQEKGEDINSYTESEKAVSVLSFSMMALQENGLRSQIFKVIPTSQDRVFLSPWALLLTGTSDPQTTLFLEHWKNLVRAYHQDNHQAWNNASEALYKDTFRKNEIARLHPKLKAEYFYAQTRPFYISALFYSFVLTTLLAFHFKPYRFLKKAALLSLSGGALMHAVGILLRMYILDRPPVSTLYESILFVGFVTVLYGLFAYGFDKNKKVFWLFLSAGTGIFLHIVGFSHDQDGDSLLMLTAVLNTNFWLATHVICITAGYGFCLITSFLSHYALLKAAYEKKAEPDPDVFKTIHAAALLSLLFAATGTVLGGIWADQSWGRFWGWDPKENGALLIVLWIVWFLHGRISGQMSKLFVTAGLAYLSVIISLSWFGVNLLGVGLHSYGFTDSATIALCTFIGIETLLVTTLILRLTRRI